jgi:predicted small secreted protein
MLRLMTMRTVLLGLVAMATVLTGCTDSSGDGTDAQGTTPLVAEAVGSRFQQDAVIPENGTAPQAFVDRDRLPSCGSYAWTLNDEGPPEHIWRCLVDSLDQGDPAELIVQSPGIDSTSVSYYRVYEEGEQVEVWHRDTMGDRWWRGSCASLDPDEGPGPCEATETFE